MKLIKRLILILFMLLLALLLGALGYYYAVTKDARLYPDRLTISEKTVTLYDENGESVRGACSPFIKQTVSVASLPTHVTRAFVDTEDKRFYRHNGFDGKRILRATWNNIKAFSFKEGASTISQQLIKNTHLTQEKTIKRKLREWKLTKELERRYSKDEILEKYLNTIYFGHSCFGIASASDFYFGKPPQELTLAESAILAGLVKSPNNYSPFLHPEKCEKRKRTVLGLMRTNDSITESEREAAILEPLPTQTKHTRSGGYVQFVFDELARVAEENGFKIGGNIQIYTYLNQELQAEVEKIAQDYQESDKTLLVLNGVRRGYRACVSTVGNLQRLPGSLLKPLLVYAPALEENILSPATPILDEKVNYGGYSPENYDGKYHGYVSARECVEKSLNIPAVKTLEALTLPKATRYLEEMGLRVEKEDKSLALALGGMSKGYTLPELLAAYATLPNQGVWGECGFIERVLINGVCAYKKPCVSKRVFSQETAYLTTDILKSTAQRGTAKKLRTLPFEIAAKTGTAGTKKGNTDAYALSFTSTDCAGVWLGNADNSFISSTGGGEPCNLLLRVNQALCALYEKAGTAIAPLPDCKTVKRVALDSLSYQEAHTLTLADDLAPEQYKFYELFKSGAIPLGKSTAFSCPRITSPRLRLEKQRVVIEFDERLPRYYRYVIGRYDGSKHKTVYDGEWLPLFTDEPLAENKNYVYTITPYYLDRKGETVSLPSVTTKTGEPPNLTDKEILEKEWWKE